ncbi:MAG TPA: acetyl-CoA carboxylase biotin carboxyl carrier protein [Gemmatimonadaceae bacterium]|nr:acetyl-CoA carboxylase biotin carboxyl carrier protein [Gemmatimonadaceae bacterium]
MIDLRYVKKLVEMLDESTVDSIEISTEKGMKIRISKTPQQRGGVSVAQPMAMPVAAAPAPVVSAPIAPSAESVAAARADEARANYLEVKSPMVGTYYSSPEPGAKQYVAVGERITKGQTLCIIEAMKIMNEIESEFDGVVREILVDNAQPVEYGQVLFRIDPNA